MPAAGRAETGRGANGHRAPDARPLLLADTPWLLYRSFFALPRSIRGAAGEPVNALLGTVNALLAAVEATRPRAVVACFGAEEAAYRVKLFSAYHAHREPMPPELASQWRRMPGLLEALGWSVAGSETLEADDLLFSYACEEADAGGRALLLTGDRDLYAAVRDRVSILELGRGGEGSPTEIGPEQVRARCGVDPALVADLIALRGDPSDGIPGAPGVGAKTAAALLGEHGSLEGAIAAAERGATGSGGTRRRMSPRIVSALLDSAAQLRCFKEVATLQRIAVERPIDSPTDYLAGAAVAREIGLMRLAERLERTSAERP